ncbi:uncharacterized protein LOC143041178 isoform X2 [Oratosquilla oratoria]|uniref:uncharacterized protein LOC143041178 isoform X2 n=1 Tax=Oratosquilla oratoria TaxID=337810 RepID=UPI003F76FC15
MAKVKTIYFMVGTRLETAHLHDSLTEADVKELFRCAAETATSDVLKLHTADGVLLQIAPDIPANTPASPYSLTVVAAKCDGFYKAGVTEPRGRLPETHPCWKNVEYRRKVDGEVKEVVIKFKSIWDSVVNEDVKQCLRLPSFNNWQWDDGEILLLLQHMYLELGFMTKFSIETEVLRNFLCTVYHHYNQVPFHNFQHAFCVTQMMYGMTWKCDLLRRLGDLEVLILLTSCVCHDLDHPGFNNIYQINAKTELALRYNDISPLENHHCSIAFTILENHDCNIFRNLSQEDYRKIREGMIRSILATDMARHNEILQEFKDISPNFDFDNKAHTNLLGMVLIKVADISNEARPLDIAEPWLECLLQEFFNQSDLEKLEGLPVTPFMDREKVTKPSSQCAFIGFVLLPLFEALGEVLHELEDLIIQPVREALEHYRRLNEASKKPSDTPAVAAVEDINIKEQKKDEIISNSMDKKCSRQSSIDISRKPVQKTESSNSIRSRASSRASFHQRSIMNAESETDLDGSVTETEVDVSERTSKFKISTDVHKPLSRRSSSERRSSYERTVSPKALEERLNTHKESELEHENDTTPPPSVKSQKETSIFSRFRFFSERLAMTSSSAIEKEHNSNGSTSGGTGEVKPNAKGKQGSGIHSVLRRSRSKSEPGKGRSHRTFLITRPKMCFGSAETKNSDQVLVSKRLTDVDNKYKSIDSGGDFISPADLKSSTSYEILDPKMRNIVRADPHPSPTLSEKCVQSPNSILQHKKYSLSLDMLPRKNYRARKDFRAACQTCNDTPEHSCHDLLESSSLSTGQKRDRNVSALISQEKDQRQSLLASFGASKSSGGNKSVDQVPLVLQESPRYNKKRHDLTRSLIFKSFSFRRRCPGKDELEKNDLDQGRAGGKEKTEKPS